MMNEHRFLFTVLLALVRQEGKENISLSYDNDNKTLLLNGKVLPLEGRDCTEEGMADRIHFLALKLGVRELNITHADTLLQGLLKEKGAVTADEIIDVVKSSTLRKDSTGDTIKQWRQALEMRVLKAGFSHVRIEWPLEVPAEDGKDYLECGPLLEKWPRSLLEDKFWAYTEPGFPGTEPFLLDEIWTDLSLINPQEEGESFANTLESSFTKLLDYRYEQRQWFTEPAEFVMEQLQGTVAVIGPPGSGKTTMMKWLARKLIMNPDGKFLLPLFVPLRQYALNQHPANNKRTDIVDYALQTAGVSSQRQRELWLSFLDSLSGSRKDNILLLLDGWDEVPANKRDRIKKELIDLAHRYSYVITSRPSAYPKTLPTDRYYEIAELSWDSIYKLVIQWFGAKKEPAMADSVLQYLDKYPDLKRLARNPFLLSLLCGYTFFRHRSPGMILPRSRTQLYRHSILSIIQQHNARFPQYKFENEKCREIEQLAYWLFTAASNAPRYTFDLEDIEKTGGTKQYMEKTLKPARLITRNDSRNESYHFLHTTFQEYFAACHIAGKEPKTVEKIFRGIAFDAAWQEIFSFTAGLASQPDDIKRQFWHSMKENAASPDRFGFVYIQLSRFIAEAEAGDGGTELLGVNLLEKLWQFIVSEEKINDYVDAYIRLDAAGYIEKVKGYLEYPNISSRLEAKLIRSLKRVKLADTSDELVRQILTGKENASAVASYQISGVLDSKGLQVLLTEAINRERSVVERKRIVRALGYSGRLESLDVLLSTAKSNNDTPELEIEAITAMGHIGGDGAVECLNELFEEKNESDIRIKIVYALGNCRCLAARDFFLFLLAVPSDDHILTEMILEALNEMPVNRGSGMLSGYLNHSVPGIRSAAAAALANAAPAKGQVTDVLIKAANEDKEPGVRMQTLASLKDRARPTDAQTLARIIESDERSLCEKANALRALAMTSSRCRNLQDGPWLHRLALSAVREALKQKKGDLALEAAQVSYMFGKDIEPLLLKILKDDSYSSSIQEYAVESLGKLKSKTAEPLLLELLNAFPDSRGDEDEIETNPGKRLAQRAAKALTHINPGALLNQKGSTAHNVLADFALKNGLLVYDDQIIYTLEKDVSGLWNEKEDLKSIHTCTEPESEEIVKKKILILSANPRESARRLALDEEIREIEEVLKPAIKKNEIDFMAKLGVRNKDFRRELSEINPHLLHFAGHGSPNGLLVLDEVGFKSFTTNEAVSRLFELLSPGMELECVFFDACDTENLAAEVSKYVPYAIGMKEEIEDDAAIQFSIGFYEAIKNSKSIEEAFKLGCLAIQQEFADESFHLIPVLKKKEKQIKK